MEPSYLCSNFIIMKKVLFLSLLIVPVFILIFCTASTTKQNKLESPTLKDGFAVVELFTSQGCSSCPAADRLLGKYSGKENVFVLSFHVDYWNKLGWKDPFSNADFTERQRMYSKKLNADVYTPQAVVNGQKEMVGSDEGNLSAAINKFSAQQSLAQINVTNVQAGSNEVSFNYNVSGKADKSVLNAALVQNKITTSIKAGENEGVNLTNYNVVRNFKTFDADGKTNSITFQLPSGYNKNDIAIILFVQEKTSEKITAAAKFSL